MTAKGANAAVEVPVSLAHGHPRPATQESEWRLPSGEDLISFALAAGVAVSPLLPAAVSWPSGQESIPAGAPTARRRRG